MERMLTRRGLLQGAASVGSAGAVASLSGCMAIDGGTSLGESGPTLGGGAQFDAQVPTALSVQTYEDRFSSVVNLVEDYGADPSGEEPIGPALSRAWENDTLIVVPEGLYKMNRGFRRTNSSNVGLIGQNAVIRHGRVDAISGHIVTEGEYSGGTMLFRSGTPSDPHQGELVFGGFVFDWGWHENAGMQGLNTMVDGRAEIRNIQFHGMHSLGTHGNMRVAPLSPESLAIVDSIDMRWGAKHYRHTINNRSTVRRGAFPDSRPPPSWSTTGIACYEGMQGTTHFNNIYIGGWPDNGIYQQSGEGRKILTNCVAANSNIANIRLGNGDAWESIDYLDGDEGLDSAYAQSTVENCVVMVDKSPDKEWYQSQRGVWLRKGDCAVRDSQIVVQDDIGPTYGASSGSAVAMSSGLDEAALERLSIALHSEGHAILSTGGADVSITDVEIDTIGWDGARGRLIDMPASLENVVVDGTEIT